MRFPLFTKVLLVAALFVILGVLWSWAAAGALSIAASLLLMGVGGSAAGAPSRGAGRRTGSHAPDGAAAGVMASDGGGCDSGGGFDGGGGCGGGE